MEILPPPASPEKLSTIVYGLEDKLPLGTSVLVGVQHVSAMVVGTITPAAHCRRHGEILPGRYGLPREHCPAGLSVWHVAPGVAERG